MRSFINFTPAFPPLLLQEELIQYSLKADVVTDEGNGRNEMRTLDKDMKLEELYKVGSESELNSWLDSSVG